MEHKLGYINRIKNISFEEAKERVQDKLGYVITKESRGLMWTKSTKSTFFLDKEGRNVAVYNHTVHDFWFFEVLM